MTKRHASVNLVYDEKLRYYAKDNRTKFNCSLRIGISEA